MQKNYCAELLRGLWYHLRPKEDVSLRKKSNRLFELGGRFRSVEIGVPHDHPFRDPENFPKNTIPIDHSTSQMSGSLLFYSIIRLFQHSSAQCPWFAVPKDDLSSSSFTHGVDPRVGFTVVWFLAPSCSAHDRKVIVVCVLSHLLEISWCLA